MTTYVGGLKREQTRVERMKEWTRAHSEIFELLAGAIALAVGVVAVALLLASGFLDVLESL